MLHFRKEPVVSVTLIQLPVARHTDEKISMTNFRPEGLRARFRVRLRGQATGQATRHFSLK